MPVILKEQRAWEKVSYTLFLNSDWPLLKCKCLEMDTRIQFPNPPYLLDFSLCDVFPVYFTEKKQSLYMNLKVLLGVPLFSVYRVFPNKSTYPHFEPGF